MKPSDKKIEALLALYETGRNLCFCAPSPPSPPQPDPNIGAAAAANAEVAREALTFNKQIYEEGKPRQAEFDALTKKVVNDQLDISKSNQEKGDEQWDRFKSLFFPVEDQVVKEAMEAGSDADQEREAGLAGGAIESQAAMADEQTARRMASMGVNPNSGKWVAAQKTAGIAKAATKAGSMNNARILAKERGVTLRAGAANFGRGLPNTAANAYGIALTGGNSAVGNGAASNNMALANASQMNQGFGTAINGNQSAGNLYLGQYNAQLGAWNAQAGADAQAGAQTGQLAGMGISAAIAI